MWANLWNAQKCDAKQKEKHTTHSDDKTEGPNIVCKYRSEPNRIVRLMAGIGVYQSSVLACGCECVCVCVINWW